MLRCNYGLVSLVIVVAIFSWDAMSWLKTLLSNHFLSLLYQICAEGHMQLVQQAVQKHFIATVSELQWLEEGNNPWAKLGYLKPPAVWFGCKKYSFKVKLYPTAGSLLI